MQDALPKCPAVILDILAKGDSFTVAEVCGNYGSGQIEDQRPKAVVLSAIRERQRLVKLATATGPSDVAKGACLDRLAKLERSVHDKTPWPPEY
jgi:hypothetical protein